MTLYVYYNIGSQRPSAKRMFLSTGLDQQTAADNGNRDNLNRVSVFQFICVGHVCSSIIFIPPSHRPFDYIYTNFEINLGSLFSGIPSSRQYRMIFTWHHWWCGKIDVSMLCLNSSSYVRIRFIFPYMWSFARTPTTRTHPTLCDESQRARKR